MSNHRGDCDRARWRYSGDGYNRVRLCACGAEDHAPDAASIRELRALSSLVAASSFVPDFPGDTHPTTMTALPCSFCRGYDCKCIIVDFETSRRMLLEAGE